MLLGHGEVALFKVAHLEPVMSFSGGRSLGQVPVGQLLELLLEFFVGSLLGVGSRRLILFVSWSLGAVTSSLKPFGLNHEVVELGFLVGLG